MEWTNKYNAFNSLKGLMYVNEYEAVLKGKLLPPVNVSIAPYGGCNLKCEWCNSKLVTGKKPQMMQGLDKLIKDWQKWGVEGFCFAGTGEPSLYPNLDKITSQIKGECSMITNGTNITYDPDNFKWIGVSLDAGTAKTYEKLKGVDAFYKVIENITKLAESKAEITVKFLISPDNCHEIYLACQVAKDLGVQNFHARPVSYGFKDVEEKPFTPEQLKSIDRQMEKCFKLDDKKFSIYGIRHKFSPEFKVVHNFKKCLASPLLFCAESDGYAYYCLDHRGEERFRMCKLEDIQKYWGSKEHLKFIKSIQPKKDCPSRCTLCSYQEQIENCIIKDKMNRRFP